MVYIVTINNRFDMFMDDTVKGFYNIDYAKIDAQTSSGGSFLTGFFVGRYFK